MKYLPDLRLLALLSLLLVGLTRSLPAQVEGPDSAAATSADMLAELVGSRARVVWIQDTGADNSDSLARSSELRLMGLDTSDDRGERAILSRVGSYVKPLLTADGEHIVYTDRQRKTVYVVDFEGRKRRRLCAGFALDVWRDPESGVDWVYVCRRSGSVEQYEYEDVRRIRMDNPVEQVSVWDKSRISPDNFQVSADGRMAAGVFPWPAASLLDIQGGRLIALTKGCWPSLAPDASRLAWVFDGPHRNLLMFAPNGSQWQVPVFEAAGQGAHEVFHPRWSNSARFLTLSGPFNVKGPVNLITGGGPQVEIFVGRFAADFRRVEQWVQVTRNQRADFFPDVWIEPNGTGDSRLADTEPDSPHGLAPKPDKAVESVEVLARCIELSLVPDPRDIAPYRQALVAHHYHVEKVLKGTLQDDEILVAHWAIRDRQVLPMPSIRPGAVLRLKIDPYDSHRELKGERRIVTVDRFDAPLFYDVTEPPLDRTPSDQKD